MDPIAIGTAVGTTLISALIKNLLEKAVDPEFMAKGIKWVFSAVDHFIKVRKKEKSGDTPIPLPPGETADPKSEVSEKEIEEKEAAAKAVIASIKEASPEPVKQGVKLVSLDEFATQQLGNEIASLLKQLEIYLDNLNFEEEKAAQYGGVQFAPIIVKNTIRLQQEEIAKRVLRLNGCMEQAYGISASGLEALTDAAGA